MYKYLMKNGKATHVVVPLGDALAVASWLERQQTGESLAAMAKRLGKSKTWFYTAKKEFVEKVKHAAG